MENTYPQLFLTLNIVLGGGGGNCNVVLKYGNAFRRSAQIFDNYGFCITVPRYFVQDCLNLTIVGNSAIAVFFRSDMHLGAFRDLLLRVLWLFLKELSNRLSVLFFIISDQIWISTVLVNSNSTAMNWTGRQRRLVCPSQVTLATKESGGVISLPNQTREHLFLQISKSLVLCTINSVIYSAQISEQN